MQTLKKHLGYEGTAELDLDLGICRGKVLFINDLVTYQARDVKDLQKAFEEAVDDYIDTCRSLNRDPQKPFSGVFQVRLQPSLHRAAALRAAKDDMSLNEVVCKAVEKYTDDATVSVAHEVPRHGLEKVTRVALSSIYPFSTRLFATDFHFASNPGSLPLAFDLAEIKLDKSNVANEIRKICSSAGEKSSVRVDSTHLPMEHAIQPHRTPQ